MQGKPPAFSWAAHGRSLSFLRPRFRRGRIERPADRSLPLTRVGDVVRSAAGREYPVVDGIPRFVTFGDAGQRQTAESFGFKWNRQPQWGIRAEHAGVMWHAWKDIFGWDSPDELRALMADRVVLDAGCGSGTSLNQFVDWPAAIAAVDISTAVDACRATYADRRSILFAQADLMSLPFGNAVFDVIWCAGVLHHTPDTYAALGALCDHVRDGGLIIFYVYLRKAPIREFVDDYLRGILSPLPPEEAWARLEPLTRFAEALSALNATFVVPEDVPELGFRKGEYNLQRFVYYNMMKCYWNADLDFDANVHVNFDWYHPRYAHRHSPDEVRGWLGQLGLAERSLRVSDSGIAVVAEKLPR